MSLDLIPNSGESYNLLNVIAKRINNLRSSEPLKAIKEIVDIEADIERAKIKETPISKGKTVIDPEITESIRKDMEERSI